MHRFGSDKAAPFVPGAAKRLHDGEPHIRRFCLTARELAHVPGKHKGVDHLMGFVILRSPTSCK
jgi:hypothetical protein